MWSTKIPPAGLSCYPTSLCYLLDGSRTLEPFSVRKGRSLHIRLCIMFSIFVDFDGYKRGPTSRHDVGMRYKEIVTLRRTYIILAIVWVVCLVASLFFHLKLPYSLLVQLYSYTIFPDDLNRLLHKDFPRSRSSSGSNTRSCSTTTEPTKCTEHGAIQKGSVQCTVGAVSFSCLLCTTFYDKNCDLS